MSYELTGKLLIKYDTVQKSETFRSREFVIEKNEEINGRFIPNFIKFQCLQDRVGIVDAIKQGDEVKVHFNIKGNKWEKNGSTSYFTNLVAWRIEPVLQSAGNEDLGNSYESTDTFTSSDESAGDDLPF